MKTTKEQLLRNPDIQPSSDVIAKALYKWTGIRFKAVKIKQPFFGYRFGIAFSR